MELSILVARTIAVIYISAGIGVLVGQINFNRIADDFHRSPALTYVCGSMGMVIGMLLIRYHNHWIRDWTVLVTLFSWALFAGGFIVVVYPRSLLHVSRYYRHSRLLGIYMIGFGLLFFYFGFIR